MAHVPTQLEGLDCTLSLLALLFALLIGLAQTAIWQQCIPLLVGDLDGSDVPLTQPCIKEGFRSVLAVPVKTKEHVVGVI